VHDANVLNQRHFAAARTAASVLLITRADDGRRKELQHEASVQASAVRGSSAGKVNWKVAPQSGLPVAHKRPPCASIMERLSDRPIPVP
jgi:hypothetical protein